MGAIVDMRHTFPNSRGASMRFLKDSEKTKRPHRKRAVARRPPCRYYARMSRIRFRIVPPVDRSSGAVYISGNHPALGSWNPAEALPLSFDGVFHTAAIEADTGYRLEYKIHRGSWEMEEVEAFGKFQPHIVERVALINTGDVEGHMALDAFFNGAGKHFAVGDVAVAATGHGADVFDGEAEVCAGAFEVNLVGAVHERLECGHAGGHAAVVERADFEIEILERRSAHLGLLGHGGRGPAEDDPFGFVDAPVHDRPHFSGDELHFFVRHIAHLGDVVAAADGDVGVHFFHAREFHGGGGVESGGFRSKGEFAGEAGVVVLDEGDCSAIAHGTDQGHADRVGHIEEVDQDFFAGAEFRGVLGEDGGQFVAARVVHGGKISVKFFRPFRQGGGRRRRRGRGGRGESLF
jgi:hypothetical protein